jgi:hypothetical protein
MRQIGTLALAPLAACGAWFLGNLKLPDRARQKGAFALRGIRL